MVKENVVDNTTEKSIPEKQVNVKTEMTIPEEVYVYDTRKNADDYNPLSDDEDFGEEMQTAFSKFDRYMKGPDRQVKGSPLCNTISNVRRIFVILGVKDLTHFLIILLTLFGINIWVDTVEREK